MALRLRSKAHRESILVFVQRAIQDLTFNRGARVITGPALTDLDLNKEMAIFGNSYREIHKIFYFPHNEEHQVFLEPESKELETVYLQGLSTSLPIPVQAKILKTIPALREAKVEK